MPPQEVSIKPAMELDGNPLPTRKRRLGRAVPAKMLSRNKPGRLCQLNLDVLFLIATFIHPIDLLNLARTCKALRRLLMDKSSEFIWKSARLQVPGLPGCPADLAEPQYANLVFHPRCHGCGRYTRTIFWKIRHRYCSGCRVERLRSLSSCHEILRTRAILASELVALEGGTISLVDREQADSFMREYDRSSDKTLFLSHKEYQCSIICKHASDCEKWKKSLAMERRTGLEIRRKQRETSIFSRLKAHGYEPEVAYFGHRVIQETRQSDFRSSKLLTEREWAWIWPEWRETMEDFKCQRLEATVYPARRKSLAAEFASYLVCLPPSTSTIDILPHVTDIARFPPFRAIIKAPEELPRNSRIFEYALVQLPAFIDNWRNELDAKLAELVKIPSHLSFEGTTGDEATAVGRTTLSKSFRCATDKLHLACAVFDACSASIYPDVLAFMYPQVELKYWLSYSGNTELTLPIENRFKIRFVMDAPYIVHAVGLDPHVATVEDMDRRNARVKCLSCNCRLVWGWRDAMQHAALYHPPSQIRPFRWKVIGREHMDEIQALELAMVNESCASYTRCLLCLACVGDARKHMQTTQHLVSYHGIQSDDIKQDVHYVKLKPFFAYRAVEMIEKDGNVSFRKPYDFYSPYP